MFFRKRPVSLAMILALASPLLAGCAVESHSSPPSAEQVASELPSPNQELWTLPSESFDPPSEFLMEYARDLLASPCWKQNGLDIPVRRYNPQAPRSQTRSDSNYALLSEDVAQVYGYSLDLDSRINWEDREGYWNAVQALSTEQLAVFDRCVAEPDKAVGMDGSKVLAWGLSSPTDIPLTPQMEEASQTWRECMAPLGISDLSSEVTPEMMPTPGAMLMFGTSNQDLPPWEPAQPSSEEIRIAVHDARCRQQAKWQDLFYPAAWNYELQKIADNYEYFSAARIANEEWKEQLNAIVASTE